MDKKTLVVLCPNGRRHTCKVDANSTILQVLEDVCTKQGLNVEDYDIKHHNKCLDTSTIIRFSGLPNNAQLELTEAVKTRSESAITLGMQLENGSRLVGSFTPDDSLWEVLMRLCPEEASPDTNPLIIYMRRNIYGRSTFESTNLRSLGITGGRAMLRLIHRSPDELGVQANVSTPLPSKPVEDKPYVRKLQKSDLPQETPIQQAEVLPHVEHLPTQSKPASSVVGKKTDIISKIKEEKRKHGNTSTKHAVQESGFNYLKENPVEDMEFIFLGNRNAMIFSQDTAHAVPAEDLPNDFYELTLDDAKKLLNDIKRRRLELENAPLQTSAWRSLQQSNREMSLLNKYKMAIIRIYFPDFTVLQGTFNPTDTIQTVMEFVREYLEHPKMEFYLYMSPPKQILEADKRLMEVDCVPNAVLHFGTTTPIKKNEVCLRRNLTKNYTTPSLASLAAATLAKENTRAGTTNPLYFDYSDVNVGASTSTAPDVQYQDYPAAARALEPQKLPKWFKPA